MTLSINRLSFQPTLLAMKVIEDKDSCNLYKETIPRFLALAQLISSVIALPILLIVGLLSTLFKSFQGEGTKAFNDMTFALKFQLIVSIPSIFAGIFTPSSTYGSITEDLAVNFSDSYQFEPMNLGDLPPFEEDPEGLRAGVKRCIEVCNHELRMASIFGSK